jgi:beta-phosphoglucomutase family hydrolase
MLGLPDAVTVCLFDLDGVLTDTAAVHDKAWSETFDAFLRARPEPFVPFDPAADYETYVDGKPRADGVRDFLASRGIKVPEETIKELGDRKNEILLRRLGTDGVKVFKDSLLYVKAARDAGLRRIVVSASANTSQVLEVSGLKPLVEGWIDGIAVTQRGLRGKPAPDTFLAGARCVDVGPERAAVFEDAVSGVEAGRAGGFGCVVGVNRIGPEHGAALRAHGADIVVHKLSELLEEA